MKRLQINLATLLFISLVACNETTKKEYHADHENFKQEIEGMKTKLEATEAQLLNVSAELSELKNELKSDSIIIGNE